jgi:hypothetical protein
MPSIPSTPIWGRGEAVSVLTARQALPFHILDLDDREVLFQEFADHL